MSRSGYGKYTLILAGYLYFYICSKWLVLYVFGTALFIHHIGMWEDVLKKKCAAEAKGLERKEQSLIRSRYKRMERILLIFGIAVLIGGSGLSEVFEFL